mmetsp:Transcript_3128/g.12893  ORF Transcript_3128/g.12893 Transcript_3128/m.12893 type:complete len:144 (+) Transcript_3128:894-1325(+)
MLAAEEAAAASLRAERAEAAEKAAREAVAKAAAAAAAAEGREAAARAETAVLAGQLDELVSCIDGLCEALVSDASGEHASAESDAGVMDRLAARVPAVAEALRQHALLQARAAAATAEAEWLRKALERAEARPEVDSAFVDLA